MSKPSRLRGRTTRRRRYLIHLSCVRPGEGNLCSYKAHIHPWPSRKRHFAEAHERVFADEYELIEVFNPLLPSGSDVRNVLSHIESVEGFFYLLPLIIDQAGQLGWSE